MMIRILNISLIIAGLVVPVFAQKSDAADKQADSWFDNVRDTFLKRTTALQAGDIDLWQAAGTKALGDVTRGNLFFALPKFNPLWDRNAKLVAGAGAKYAKRLEQIPGAAIKRWQTLTDAEPLYAAMSLTAENALFPQEKFSGKSFETFAAKFK